MIKQLLSNPGAPTRPQTLRAHAHPVFTRLYAAVAALGERGEIGRRREELLSGVTGRLLIVGLGPGHDLEHLPAGVREVVAVEPSPAMNALAAARVRVLRERGVRVVFAAAVGEALPLADASVDAVLCAFVLCSVSDPAQTLAEVRRVLRPGGRLLLLEHVRAPRGSLLERVQVRVDPLWRRLAGGCSCARDTRATVRAAGFEDGELQELWMANAPLCACHLVGPAAQPAAGAAGPAAAALDRGGSEG